MKLLVVLLTTAFVQVHAMARAQHVSLSGRDLPMAKVLEAVEKQTGYVVFGNQSLLSSARLLTLNTREMPLAQFLELISKNQPVEFLVRDKTIILVEKTAKPSPLAVFIPQPPISGVIKGADGPLLPGASISVKGSSVSAVTAADGSFTLNVKTGDVLVISYIGYATLEHTITAEELGKPLQLTLAVSQSRVTELVVVGYGTRAKGAITGAISTVKSEVFENRPLNNTMDALQGTVPGMTITRASGRPGNQGYTLQVRGYSSINGNQPLVLVDGIPGELSTLNPSDILQISVLKDAAAAIYGARAADGVIIVTTKRGVKGPPTVNYTLNVGLKTPAYLRKIQNTLQFAEFMDEGLRNAGIQGFPQDVFDKIRANAEPNLQQGWNYGITSYPGFYGYTNWNKEIYKNPYQQLHNIAVSGGSETSSYLLSVGYNHDDGTIRFGENFSDRYNVRLNYDVKLTKKLSLETRSSFENIVTKEPNMLSNALTNVTRQFPYQPVYNQKGQFYGYQGYENPAQSLAEAGQRKYGFSRFNTNLKLDYNVIDGLKLTGQAAFRLDYVNEEAVSRTFTRYNYVGDIQDVRNVPNNAYYRNQKTLYKLYQVYADYNKRFGDHGINITAGTSLEQTNNEGQNITGYNFPSNDIFTLNLADRTNPAFANFSGLLQDQALASYFGRISYSYRDKWILDVTGRADGSSKFSPANRWSAVFPSVALAYNLSEEQFIKDLRVFDQLKVRGTWGKMGNQDLSVLGLYDYIPLISIGGVYPLGSPNAGLPGAVANPASADRTWETIENRNIGIDAQVLDGKLGFSFDYFNKINNDMLVSIAVPATFGGTPPSSNQGKLVTKGFETSLTWRDKIGDLKYSVQVLLSDSRNQLVELKNSDNYNEGLNYVRQGYSIYSYFGYVYDGIIKTQEQLTEYKKLQNIPNNIGIGDVMFRDVDGDGVLTAFGDKSKGLNGDMVYLGNLLPRYTYSSNINLSYKQFNLAMFLQGVGKRDIRYEGAIATPNTFFWPSLEYYYGKTWTPDRPDAPFPRYIPGSVGFDGLRNYNYRTSTLTMQNVSYMRFKTITLGYDIPAHVAERAKLRSARVYVSGQDLFTISKGTMGGNFDPEDGYRNEGTYPFAKVYSIGLDVKF